MAASTRSEFHPTMADAYRSNAAGLSASVPPRMYTPTILFPCLLASLTSQSTQGLVCVSLPMSTTTVVAQEIFIRKSRRIVSSFTRPRSKRCWFAGFARIELFLMS